MRIKAFTILEALIGLLLISLIIGLVFTLLNFMGQQISIFSERNTEELEYNLFDTTFLWDIENAHDFIVLNKKITLESYDKSVIEYAITKEHILRNNFVKTDTFKLKVLSFKTKAYHKGRPLNKVIEMDISILNDTINANYFLEKTESQIINNTFLNED